MERFLAEQAERLALVRWHEAAATLAPGIDWRLVEVGDALCSVSADEPSILVNRVLGLGSSGPVDENQVRDIRNVYADVGRHFVHVIADQVQFSRLAAGGYQRHRGWMKFTRLTENPPIARSNLDVREVDLENALDFARIAGDSFGLQKSSWPLVAAVVAAEGYRSFMSFEEGVPAGTGVVFLDGEIGVLDWGATDPAFRRRGGQGAVLAARIECAAAAGCRELCTMTGEAVDGEDQLSYRNIMKSGFEESYLRENWVPVT